MTRYGSNATRWFTTVEAVKTAGGNSGSSQDALIGQYIEAASADIEVALRRRFIPEVATKLYQWPQRLSYGGSSRYQTGAILFLADDDLLAITTLLSGAQDASPTTIAAADYYLEPNNIGPPYNRIEIDLASSSSFGAGTSPQRSISVAGRWGYSGDTKAAGALAEADDGTETALDVTDSGLIGVGDTLLIGTEAMFVSARGLLDTTANTAGTALTASKAETTVPVNTGTLIKAGEVITIDSERMLVESVSGNNLTVVRAYDGSTLASHASPSDVYAPRTLTVVRAVNGTTGAAHDTAAAISKYAPPADIVLYCLAKALLALKQGESGWTGQIGGGEAGVVVNPWSVRRMREELQEKYRRVAV